MRLVCSLFYFPKLHSFTIRKVDDKSPVNRFETTAFCAMLALLHFTLLLAAAAAAFDLASLQKLLPQCSLLCLADGVTQHNCSLTDFECQCNNIEPIIKTVSPCLVKAGCDLQNITATGRVVLDVCKTLPGANETKPGGSGDATTGSTRSAAGRDGASWGLVLVVIVAAASVLL